MTVTIPLNLFLKHKPVMDGAVFWREVGNNRVEIKQVRPWGMLDKLLNNLKNNL